MVPTTTTQKQLSDATTLTPLDACVHYPAGVTLDNANEFMHMFGAVHDIQTQSLGKAFVTCARKESAYVALGTKTSYGNCGAIRITTGTPSDDNVYNAKIEKYPTHVRSIEPSHWYGTQCPAVTFCPCWQRWLYHLCLPWILICHPLILTCPQKWIWIMAMQMQGVCYQTIFASRFECSYNHSGCLWFPEPDRKTTH